MSASVEGDMGILFIQWQFGSSEDKDNHDDQAALARKATEFSHEPYVSLRLTEALQDPGDDSMGAFHLPFVRGNALQTLLSHIPSLETKTTGLYELVLLRRAG